MIDQLLAAILETLRWLPPEATTAILAAFPIGEARLSIPVGWQVLHLNIVSVFIWSVVGNAVAAIAFLHALHPMEIVLDKHWPSFHRFLKVYLHRAREKFSGTHAKYGAIGLVVFIAIPIPLTGAWTGAAAAHIMDLPKPMASLSISLGVISASVIVTLATLGVVKLF